MNSTVTSEGSIPPLEADFSPVENELPLRWLRRLRLLPPHELGVHRRALFLAAVTWVPIAIWAVIAGRQLDLDDGESILRHYGVHVRCLLAVPLFILAEAVLHRTARRIALQFSSSGIVPAAQQPAFAQSLQKVRHLRDSSLPWVFMVGAVIAAVMIDHPTNHADAYSWALAADGTLGFGGWWFAYVARPIFIGLLLGWLWRMLPIAYWMWRIGRLELSLVPTHPDRAGGLGFLHKLPGAFSLVTFALSAVIASRWAHEIQSHEATLLSFAIPLATFVVVWTLFCLLPLLALAPGLYTARARAMSSYAALVGEQGRLVHRRWILGEPVPDNPVLHAPEIGPVVDANSMYEAVKNMRLVPIGKVSIIASILVPLALPMLVVASLQIPLADLVMDIVKAVL